MKKYVVKKTEYNELVKEVNNISITNTSDFVKKLILTKKLLKLEMR